MKEVKTCEEYVIRELERKNEIINEMENERNADNEYILKLEKEIEDMKKAIELLDLREDIFSTGTRRISVEGVNSGCTGYEFVKKTIMIKEGKDYRD